MSRRDEMNEILKQVEIWSREERAFLAHAILDTLTEGPRGPKPTMDEVVGIGRGEGPAPTDEQVKQWIYEHRMRKYG